MKKSRLLFALPAVALTVGQIQMAHAEDLPSGKTPIATAIEEVVVTAERKSQNSQKTALSMTVLRGDDLAVKAKSEPRDILQAVPGVLVQEPRPEAPLIAIRGLGSDGPSRTASTGSTAIYLDGTLVTQNAAQFYDISRVEVLRGPQGTLYGRGATGGAVNFITNDPTTDKLSGSLSAELGNYNLRHFVGVLNVPLSDTVAARLSFNSNKHDGYLSNGQDGLDEKNYRLKLLIKPSAGFSAILGAEHAESSGTGAGTVALNADNGLSNRDAYVPSFLSDSFGKSERNYDRFYGNFNLDVGIGTLTYIPTYQNYNEKSDQIRFDHEEAKDQPKDEWITHELRLNSKVGGDLSWVAGIYMADRTNDSLGNYTFFPGGTGIFYEYSTMKTRALFGEATYSFAPDLRGLLGLRKTNDTVTRSGYESLNFPFLPAPTYDTIAFAKSYSRNDFKLRVEKDLNKDSLVYASVSTGYRPGGYAQGTGTAVAAYEPEANRAYEIGSKNRFLNNRLQVNAGLFYYDYSGFQSVVQYTDSYGISRARTDAQAAKFKGGELEIVYRLTSEDKINLSGGYLSAKNADGTQIVRAPKWTLTGGYSHAFDLSNGGTLTAGLDARYQSEQFVTPYGSGGMSVSQAAALQKAYTLVDLNLSYDDPDGRYTVSAFVKNATDQLVKTGVQGGPVTLGSTNAPRTTGVTVNVKF